MTFLPVNRHPVMRATPLRCSVHASIDLFVVVVELEVNNLCPRGNTDVPFSSQHKKTLNMNINGFWRVELMSLSYI